MTSERDKTLPETTELREKIASLDAELTKDFKSQFSVSPFLSRKIVSFQGNKDKPAYNLVIQILHIPNTFFIDTKLSVTDFVACRSSGYLIQSSVFDISHNSIVFFGIIIFMGYVGKCTVAS